MTACPLFCSRAAGPRAPWSGLCGAVGWGCVAPEELAPRPVGAGRSVGQEFDFPAPTVDADVMMILTQQHAVLDAGGAAVLQVPDVMHVADRRALVAAACPCAVLVAEDDGAPDGLWDALRVTDINWNTLAVERSLEEPGAQDGSEGAGSGDKVDREPGHGVLEGVCLL